MTSPIGQNVRMDGWKYINNEICTVCMKSMYRMYGIYNTSPNFYAWKKNDKNIDSYEFENNNCVSLLR